MEGKKTTARRTSRTASARPAPAATKKESSKPRVAKPRTAVAVPGVTAPASERLRMVEMAAYFLAEQRGFEPGRELEDWFAAEAEIDARLVAAPEKKPARRARKTQAG